jgi:threonine/homoserine/homoserine lactone efflux protein
MYPEPLYAFILMCLLIESTPGPNMIYLTLVSASEGRRSGFATVAGITLGLLIIGLAAAVGLATIIANSPLLYVMLRGAGVLYLLWLAWLGWRDATELSPGQVGSHERLRSFFKHGLIVNLLNPKAALFYVAVLPTFIDPNEHVIRQAVYLTALSISIATIMHILIVSLAGFLRPFLENPKSNKIVRRILALLLAGVAIWFGWPTESGR